MAIERWEPVKGFEGYYEVSSKGRVRSVDRVVLDKITDKGALYRALHGKVLSPNTGAGGRGAVRYSMVYLSKDGIKYPKYVHRLVAEAFIDNVENKKEVDHINKNTSDNSIDNLRWVTHQENIKYSKSE